MLNALESMPKASAVSRPTIGIDLVSVARFRALLKPRQRHLLAKIFTQDEIAYGKRYRDSAPHLAGMFAAKEAASKALGTGRAPYLALEVRHRADGAPEIWQGKKRAPVAISITHERAAAAAVAIAI